jgi:hypothetical protein
VRILGGARSGENILLGVLPDEFNNDEIGYELLGKCCIKARFQIKRHRGWAYAETQGIVEKRRGSTLCLGKMARNNYYRQITGLPPADGAGDNNAGARVRTLCTEGENH